MVRRLASIFAGFGGAASRHGTQAELPPGSSSPQPSQSPSGSFFLFAAVPGWLTSTALHVVVLLALALVSIRLPENDTSKSIMVLNNTRDIAEDLSEFKLEEPGDIANELEAENPATELSPESLLEDVAPLPLANLEATANLVEVDPLGMEAMLTAERSQSASTMTQALSGRSAAAKKRLVREAGGSAGSEAAVASGLRWLASHQNPDGSWSLDHRGAPDCQGACRNPGGPGPARVAPFGATGLALLPFLGAGHTHLEGEYRQVVDAGLGFLLRNMRIDGPRGILADEGGNYYSHGLCAIVLGEAYALTKDTRLRPAVEALVTETIYAQDPVGGGWRYERRQTGDTSALGWQLMALKSAHMAGFQIPVATIQGATVFLDSVQSPDGFKYRYLLNPSSDEPVDPAKPRKFRYDRSTTSVGLLCRMYLGWTHEDPRLVAGINYLDRRGPSVISDSPDLYYDYYATQVMRHYGGKPWKNWNQRIRDHLVGRQAAQGHETGSWYLKGPHTDVGGRLYCTSLATMILEVYYRHLPVYQNVAVETEFPL